MDVVEAGQTWHFSSLFKHCRYQASSASVFSSGQLASLKERECSPPHSDCRNWNFSACSGRRRCKRFRRKLSPLLGTNPVTHRVTGEVPAVAPGWVPWSLLLSPLPRHLPATPTHISKAVGSWRFWQMGTVQSLLLLLRSGSSSESGWPDRFSGWPDRFSAVSVSPGAVSLPCCVTLGLTSGAPRAGISYLKLITISMESSKELPSPVNPPCSKDTFQTHGVFISIPLKPSWLVFLLLEESLQLLLSRLGNRSTLHSTSSLSPNDTQFTVPSLPTSEGIPNKHCCNLFTTPCLSSLGCTKHT